MDSSVNASVMFPQLRLTPARAAFARPGPHATAFPDVNALLQPSDSLVPVGRRSGRPSPTAYPGAEVLFFTAAPVPPLTGATPETFLPRLPISRLSPEEKRGDPRCLGHPLRACRAQRPRRVRPPLAHLSVRSLLPSGCLTPWAPWKADSFRGCMAHGPLVRVWVHRSQRWHRRHLCAFLGHQRDGVPYPQRGSGRQVRRRTGVPRAFRPATSHYSPDRSVRVCRLAALRVRPALSVRAVPGVRAVSRARLPIGCEGDWPAAVDFAEHLSGPIA